MKKYIEEKGLVRQHLDSYNDFIDTGLQEIVSEVGKIQVEAQDYPFEVKLGKIEATRPRIVEVDGSDHTIYPMETRLRNLTYSAPLYLEMIPVKDGCEGLSETVYIGNFPVMLKSKLCPLSKMTPEELIKAGEDSNDPGGYFIVNGSERVTVAMEDLAPNRILVDIDDSGTRPVYRAKVFSTTVGFRARIEIKMKHSGGIYVSIPGVPSELPIIILMRALNLESDKDIVTLVSSDEKIQDQLEPSFDEVQGISTTQNAIAYIGNRVAYGQIEEYRIKRAESILSRNFFPHIGQTNEHHLEKARFLGEMVLRVIELKLGRRKEDDRDHYANKRLRLAGPLLSDLFRIAFRSLCRDIKYQLDRMSIRRKALSIPTAVRPGIVTDRMNHALATGNWGRGRVGMTQLLDRKNFISTLSHLRRLQSPLSRSQPNFEARDLHPTHWGRLCPNETPEGSNCGLVKNLALMASISVAADTDKVIRFLSHLGVVSTTKPISEDEEVYAKIFVDGSLIGYHNDPVSLVRAFRKARRHGEIDPEVNIVYYSEHKRKVSPVIFVNCNVGRIRRPLIIIENGESKLTLEQITRLKKGEITFDDLILEGSIEYLDAEEEENAYVALNHESLTSKHTHLEIASYTILGICASTIPYAEHNQSPRNSYEAAMAKQALGVYSINYFNRADSRSHFLHYPQKPLVTTKPMEVLHYNEKPSGQNCIVAVLSCKGYNMEDAIVLNKSSIQRGMFRSFFYRVYVAEGRQYLGGLKDKFETPSSDIRGFRGEQYYKLLEEDGVIGVESLVDGSEVLIGRTSPPRFLEEYKEFELKGPTRRDTSITMRSAEAGTVDEVFLMVSAQGNRLVKVKARDQRIPELGDKFASRHGQKGVIGMVIPHVDMPFTEDGIVPDIIINPHAFPSRMTVGQFVESISGKVAALDGEVMDGTPFYSLTVDEIRKKLFSLGFQHSGREVMYDGLTGKKYEATIFIGVVYYQKLHHMVADKIHARARGQVQMLTRQPTEGRARGGGLRFGEMERDCLIGYGASLLLKDRLLDESDRTIIYACEKCGFIGFYDFKKRKYICRVCGENTVISPIVVSYAFKLLLQELMSLAIAPRMKLGGRA